METSESNKSHLYCSFIGKKIALKFNSGMVFDLIKLRDGQRDFANPNYNLG